MIFPFDWQWLKPRVKLPSWAVFYCISFQFFLDWISIRHESVHLRDEMDNFELQGL